MYPLSLAILIARSRLRPARRTFLFVFLAISIREYSLVIKEENAETMTLPCCCEIISSKFSEIIFSDGAFPGTVALVLSIRAKSTLPLKLLSFS